MHNLQDRILNSTKIHFFTSYTKSFLRKKKPKKEAFSPAVVPPRERQLIINEYTRTFPLVESSQRQQVKSLIYRAMRNTSPILENCQRFRIFRALTEYGLEEAAMDSSRRRAFRCRPCFIRVTASSHRHRSGVVEGERGGSGILHPPPEHPSLCQSRVWPRSKRMPRRNIHWLRSVNMPD